MPSQDPFVGPHDPKGTPAHMPEGTGLRQAGVTWLALFVSVPLDDLT
jgi:hypothetical protein